MATTNNFTFGVDVHPFTLNFPFIDEDNLVVTLDGVVKTLDTDYTVINKTSNTAAGVGFLSGARIQFTADPLPSSGAVKVVRDTNLETTSTFKTGSAIRAVDLNSNFTQNLYVTEEISNNAILTDGSNAFDSNLNMGGNRITNLGTPTANDNAVTKLYVDSRLGSLEVPGFTRWSLTAVGGETTLSGAGTTGGTLAYSANREQVYLNGAQLQRDTDYTANNGTSVVLNAALIAGDVVEVICVNNLNGSTSNQSQDQFFVQSGTGATTRTVESKLRDVVSVKDFGAVGDGVTDDTAAIQAAITYAQSLCSGITSPEVGARNVVVDFHGRFYRVSQTISISKPLTLKDGSFEALSGGTWTDTTMFILGATASGSVLLDINMDGGLDGTTRYVNLLSVRSKRTNIIRGTFLHFPDFGIHITSTSQESRLAGCLIREWKFEEVGTTDGTLRTATGLKVEDNDNVFSDLVIAQCQKPLYVLGGANIFTNCHFYNGASTTTAEDVSVVLDSTPSLETNSTIFSNCYFDNGAVELYDAFANSFTGCLFLRTANGTNSNMIRLVTAETNATAAGLSVVGCLFRDGSGTGVNQINFVGSGTWVTDDNKQLNWVGNTNFDGSYGYYVSKSNDLFRQGSNALTYNPPSGTFTCNSTGAYNIDTVADINLVSGTKVTIGSAVGNPVEFSVGGVRKWLVNNTDLRPDTDKAVSIGATTSKPFQVVAGRLAIEDGLTTPDTVAGICFIYVDSADGDLKIKFGDGTIKTIVTDT